LQTSVESGIRQDIIDGLEARGHKCAHQLLLFADVRRVVPFDINLGIGASPELAAFSLIGAAEVQLAMRTPDRRSSEGAWYIGASDSRKRGIPAAY